MELSGFTSTGGLLFVLVFLGLIAGVAVFNRRRPVLALREIPAFVKLRRAIGLAVEDGTRLHLSLGSGGILDQRSAAAFVGLSMLKRVADITSVSDHPPIVTSGEAILAILSQDTLQSAFEKMGAGDQYDPTSARLTGVTPFSYAAGTLPVIADEMVSSNLLAGTFVNEAALILDASERKQNFSLAGTDDLAGQALLYATAQEPLIGEELFAGGAYLEAGAIHNASLHAQDILRYLVILAILGGAALRFLGVL